MNILGKRGDLPFSRKSDRKKEKRKVSFTHVQNIICNTKQAQLDGIAHEQTIICSATLKRYLSAPVCRQLVASHGVGSRPMKIVLRMIIVFTCSGIQLIP